MGETRNSMASQGLGQDQCADAGPLPALAVGAALIEGRAYSIAYPFLITTYQPPPEGDGEEGVSYPPERETWRPGFEPYATQYTEGYYCHGWGREVRRIVSIHKPGNYPARVFYVRSWVDPDGNAFGKTSLKIKSASAFKRWALGRSDSGCFSLMEVWPRPAAEPARGVQ